MATRTTGWGRTGGDLPYESERESDARKVLAGLFRRAPLIVGCTLLAAAAALVFSLLQTKQYTADASLLFRNPGFDQQIFGSSDTSSLDPTREAATNLKLVSLKAVADRTAASLGGGLTGDTVSEKVSVESGGDADVVSIKATDPDPRFAATLANSFAQNYITFRRKADRRKVQQARALVTADFNQLSPAEQLSSEGQSLQRQISRLATLEALQTGNAELVQHATVPTSPSSPKIVRNTAVAWILGLLLGVALAALMERLDRRLRRPAEFEETFGLPVLTEVPESKALARSSNGVGELLDAEGGAFQMLRARLRYFNVDRDIRSVLVTSAAPAEGKTTVAWSLAASAASSGSSTILLEADFHQPGIAARTGTRAGPGLSEMLSGQSSLANTVQQVTVENRQNGTEEARQLDVIVAGSRPPNPVELLESEEMARLLVQLTDDYDLVIIDSPPLPILADAIPLAKLVNGVIVVGRVNKTTRDEAQFLHAQLESLDAPVLGLVANRTPRGRSYSDYYRHGRRFSSSVDDANSPVR
jgi:capsular exopolysaccharide synthesis family protein